MRHLLGRRPSAAMVVAIIALVVAASGTAVAATQLQNGDSLIKKNSLSGNRLKNHSVTGGKIKLSSLGTVPSAKHASTADSATSATNATTLAGQAPSAFDSSSNWTRSGYVSANEGSTATVATFGPFSLTLHCGTNGGTPEAAMTASSSQAFSTADGQAIRSAGGTTANPLVNTSPAFFGDPATAFEDNGFTIDFTAPGGGVWEGQVDVQTNNPGNPGQCGAIATITKS